MAERSEISYFSCLNTADRPHPPKEQAHLFRYRQTQKKGVIVRRRRLLSKAGLENMTSDWHLRCPSLAGCFWFVYRKDSVTFFSSQWHCAIITGLSSDAFTKSVAQNKLDLNVHCKLYIKVTLSK